MIAIIERAITGFTDVKIFIDCLKCSFELVFLDNLYHQ